MKRITTLLLCTLVSFSLDGTFRFVNNKTPGGPLDSTFLQKIADAFQVDIFIETGTFNGITASRAAQIFKEVHTIELEPTLFKTAQTKLKQHANITTYLGNSSETIPTIIPKISGTPLFWLDAHYCGENTALSEPDPNSAEAITAIRRELTAIKKSGITDCILLIDDIRGYGSCINGVEYCGCWAYPPVQEVCRAAQEINPHFKFALLGDSLLAFDATKYAPKFSPVVQACTKSRLYDGVNLSDQQLLGAEQIIRNAQSEERSFIHELYNRMAEYSDPLFHHDLWYGLTCLSTNKNEAEKAFLKVSHRTQHFDIKRRVVDKSVSYEHPRILDYIAESQSMN